MKDAPLNFGLLIKVLLKVVEMTILILLLQVLTHLLDEHHSIMYDLIKDYVLMVENSQGTMNCLKYCSARGKNLRYSRFLPGRTLITSS
ncbi:hypothetical protein HPP92_001870 [Vanilla planifolia]|uniref:Uncharacterized protein n=1 Tax=Vanilla planifolia TaxID=51239 RepID=A0A835SDK9_VANPL|nr:hypothetical protein HPP92_001870 [Vanilla planifolia]